MYESIKHFGTFTVTEMIKDNVYRGYRDRKPNIPQIAKRFDFNRRDLFNRELAVKEILDTYPKQERTGVVYMNDYESIKRQGVAAYYSNIDGVKLLKTFLFFEAYANLDEAFRSSLWPFSEITAFILQIGRALDFLHSVEIAHVDLHDEN